MPSKDIIINSVLGLLKIARKVDSIFVIIDKYFNMTLFLVMSYFCREVPIRAYKFNKYGPFRV